MSKLLLDDRRFLNTKGYHSVGAICSVVKWDEKDYFFSPLEAEFSISDCNKVVTLSIETESEEDLNNSIYKLTQIMEVCKNTIECLENNRNLVIAAEEKRRQEKEKRKKG